MNIHNLDNNKCTYERNTKHKHNHKSERYGNDGMYKLTNIHLNEIIIKAHNSQLKLKKIIHKLVWITMITNYIHVLIDTIHIHRVYHVFILFVVCRLVVVRRASFTVIYFS